MNVLCPCIPDSTENNTITCVNTRTGPRLTCDICSSIPDCTEKNIITCVNTRTCPRLTCDICSSIPDITENNTITCVNTRVCTGVAGECIMLLHCILGCIKNNTITCANTRVCPGLTCECIMPQHSWLHRKQYNHVWEYQSLYRCSRWMYYAPAFLTAIRTTQVQVQIEPVQVENVYVLCSCIPDYTGNRTITRVNTRACPGLTRDCIRLLHFWLHREQYNHMCEYQSLYSLTCECIVLLHSWLHREQYNHTCEYQSLSRLTMWLSGSCIFDCTENNANNTIIFVNTRACTV